jgi:hypothetical protein
MPRPRHHGLPEDHNAALHGQPFWNQKGVGKQEMQGASVLRRRKEKNVHQLRIFNCNLGSPLLPFFPSLNDTCSILCLRTLSKASWFKNNPWHINEVHSSKKWCVSIVKDTGYRSSRGHPTSAVPAAASSSRAPASTCTPVAMSSAEANSSGRWLYP